ncbi:hypothetical protein BVX97_03560 [bacterium E08(2017)]|nr:hypothetical protein BVX97_03560 [bacterium E08(2017)]
MGNKKIIYKELPHFTRKCSALLASGMPVASVLDSLHKQTSSGKLLDVITDMKVVVGLGHPLADAMKKHPDIFDSLYINLVSAGEASGRLPETMDRLADHLEMSAMIRHKIQSAMMYPTFVLLFAAVVFFAMMTFVMPAFSTFFDEAGEKLPLITRGLIAVSDYLRDSYIELILIITGIIFLFKYINTTEKGKAAIDNIALRLPIFGPLNRKLAACRFARTYGELIRSGLPIETALTISAGSTGNSITEQVLLDAKPTIAAGEPLSSALHNQSAFPKEMVEMLHAGESSGKVDEMMSNIADYLDKEIDTTITGLVALLIPVITVVIGAVVGAMVIGIFLPIFQIPDLI